VSTLVEPDPPHADRLGCVDDVMEPNNLATAARTLTVSELSSSQLRQCGADDWFAFMLAPDVGMQVRITFDSTAADLDLYLYVQRNDGLHLLDASETVFDEEVVWIPPQRQSTSVLMRVYNYGGSAASYELRTPLVPRAAHDACASAMTITAGQSVTGNTLGAANDLTFLSRACTGYRDPGGDLFYAVAVPRGQRLSATVVSDEDLALYVLDDCVSRCCWAGADFMDAGTETLMWTNDSGQDRTVVLGVDSFDARVAAPFTLSVGVDAAF